MKQRRFLAYSGLMLLAVLQGACSRDVHLISAQTAPASGYEYDVFLIDRKMKAQSAYGENAPLILDAAAADVFPFIGGHKEPIALNHASLTGKQAYIREVKETVRQFREVAETAFAQRRTRDLSKFAAQTVAYLDHYVEELLEDADMNQTPAAKIETAELHLECAWLCLEINRRQRALGYLNRFQAKYGQDSTLLLTPLKKNENPFPTLQQQYEYLQTQF